MPRSKSSRGRNRLYRAYRYVYLKLVRKNDSPERVGRGAALGIFVGVFPTLWFGPVLSVAAAGLLGANRAAALLGNVASGPLTPITWTLAVLVGNQLVREEWRIARELLETADRATITQRFFTTFLVGNVAVSAALAVAGYALAWWLALRHRRRLVGRSRAPAESLPDAG